VYRKEIESTHHVRDISYHQAIDDRTLDVLLEIGKDLWELQDDQKSKCAEESDDTLDKDDPAELALVRECVEVLDWHAGATKDVPTEESEDVGEVKPARPTQVSKGVVDYCMFVDVIFTAVDLDLIDV
jgi:hypothetical protein